MSIKTLCFEKVLSVLSALSLLIQSVLIFTCFRVPTGHCTEIQGIHFADQIKLANRTLILNGVGLRKATLFNLKIYLVGLYLEQSSRDPEKILESSEIKKLVMHFLRSVPSERLADAWKEGYNKNCQPFCSELEPALNQLTKAMVTMNKDEILEISFFSEFIEVSIKGSDPQRILGKGFSKVVLATWLGSSPPNPELKAGMLGVKFP